MYILIDLVYNILIYIYIYIYIYLILFNVRILVLDFYFIDNDLMVILFSWTTLIIYQCLICILIQLVGNFFHGSILNKSTN